jgi:alpha-amylase/alpha-mannosidase (GH57 family)
MSKYVCIHGHFYQPPRENPWLEEVEVQDSAYPYRDWNERITAECYSPNTAARIISGDQKVIDIVNNYSKISFNFGPTLLSWMEVHSPDVYKSIIQADKISREFYSGHGSAIAQVYNHLIMPLANYNDKKTQVIWGIEDFRYRFESDPEGIWLPETAVDIESLEIAAEQGIKFTILAPGQAKKIRKVGDEDWIDVSGAKIDPRRGYICNLPSGKSINLFFYDGIVSQELAFGPLLEKGENLSNRLKGIIDDGSEEPQLAHVASDGETYGHHQKHGDMALAYCINHISSDNQIKITLYGEYLEKFPPEYEVEIFENTSWSCAHGIERWKSNCGCSSGIKGWNQEWRTPLREALDWLRDTLIPIYEREAGVFVKDPWGLRNGYIKIILDRSPDNLKNVFKSYGVKKKLSEKNIVKLLKLLEMQRHSMLMYTSCGWFFDEVSGIETVQVIQYAARAIQLAKELELADLEQEFVAKLQHAKSNLPEVENGAKVYEMYVKPAIIDLYRVAAHYVVSSLFEQYSDKTKIFSYEIFDEVCKKYEAGKIKMITGRIKMRSSITYETQVISFAFLHLGDQNLNGGLREFQNEESFELMQKEMKEAFERLNIAELVMLIDKHFGSHNYTLWHLFKDESRKVFNKILQNTLNDIEHTFRRIYESYYPIMLAMRSTNTPLPKPILTAIEFIVNTDLRALFDNPQTIDVNKLATLHSEAKKWDIELDRPMLSYVGSKRINNLMELLKEDSHNTNLMEEINTSIKLLNDLSIELDLWKAQNILFIISREYLADYKGKTDEAAKKWVNLFREIEKHLHVRIE